MRMFRAECKILLASRMCMCVLVCIGICICICICLCASLCMCICIYVSLNRYAVSYNYLLETSLIVLKFFKARFVYGSTWCCDSSFCSNILNAFPCLFLLALLHIYFILFLYSGRYRKFQWSCNGIRNCSWICVQKADEWTDRLKLISLANWALRKIGCL